MLQWHEFLCCGEGAGEGDTTAGPVEVPLDEDDHESEGGIAGLAVGGLVCCGVALGYDYS